MPKESEDLLIDEEKIINNELERRGDRVDPDLSIRFSSRHLQDNDDGKTTADNKENKTPRGKQRVELELGDTIVSVGHSERWVIEYIDPDVDYNQFCINNVSNEKRKAVSAFFVNLSLNGIIPPQNIMNVLKELFESVLTLMVQPNKTNEVCELIENIAILYNAQVLKLSDNLETVINHEGVEKTFVQVITHLSTTRMKTYPSLSSKSIFKCMDL